MAEILDLYESAEASFELYHTFREGEPDTVPTGIPVVDKTLRGLFPGMVGVLGAATGIGKSSFMLTSAFRAASTGQVVGIISCEDSKYDLGSRAAAYVSGVNSTKIENKRLLNDIEAAKLKKETGKLKGLPIKVAYRASPYPDEVVALVYKLAEAGCRMIWVDYLQKIRGERADRRDDVSNTYSRIHRAVAETNVTGMVVSQLSRTVDKEPQIRHLKESGDIENEARLIILLHRDPEDVRTVYGRVAKSTRGGIEGERFVYERGDDGILRYVDPLTDYEDLEF